VTIIEYTDFQCIPCARLAAVLTQLIGKYPEEVRVVFRHYPLIGTAERPIHDKAALAMQASEAAGLQGKFWEMHDLLFARQEEWSGFSAEQYQAWLAERAGELGMNKDRFSTDLTSQAIADRAKAAWDEGQASGIPYAPFVLVNDRIWSQDVPLDYQALSDVIALKLMEAKQYTSCPPLVIDPTRKYFATLQTDKGDIVIELYADKAPMAVNSFVFLAGEGWYDGVIFHRVIPDFVAQAGDPSGSGYGGPGYAFDNEISPDLKFDAPGVVGMVNAGPGSNNSQFFITYAPAPNLDGGYTIFGRVISGMEVLKSLTPRNPAQPGALPEGDVIEKVTIEER
jgi:cyclophilin family peptidyl-prolyl cis-trans isomerase/predicted DsbA family dithiol-disulfide isomerase